MSPIQSISPKNIARYCEAVRRQPGIRPEMLARARKLAADPNYPPVAVMRQIACRILAAPDLSEKL